MIGAADLDRGSERFLEIARATVGENGRSTIAATADLLGFDLDDLGRFLTRMEEAISGLQGYQPPSTYMAGVVTGLQLGVIVGRLDVAEALEK